MPTERRFELEGAAGPVPAIVWLPGDQGGPYPLVLAGHGGGGHKADAFVAGQRDRLLPRGIAVAAIDAVGHGDRVAVAPAPEDIVRVISDAASYPTMVSDWTATLDALLATGDFDPEHVGYVGLSGGCLFGLPYVADDRRIVAAVLGACGYEGAPLLGDAPSTFAPVLREAARRYVRPALLLLQGADDVFPASGGRALFADLASPDKHLIASPGAHTEVPLSAVDAMAEWMASRLEAESGD